MNDMELEGCVAKLDRCGTKMEKWSKGQEQGSEAMSDVTLANDLIREAYPTARYGNAKAAIWAAYRGLSLRSIRRARALYNGEAKRVDAHEMDALRRAAIEELARERNRALEKIRSLEAMAARSGDHGASTAIRGE